MCGRPWRPYSCQSSRCSPPLPITGWLRALACGMKSVAVMSVIYYLSPLLRYQVYCVLSIGNAFSAKVHFSSLRVDSEAGSYIHDSLPQPQALLSVLFSNKSKDAFESFSSPFSFCFRREIYPCDLIRCPGDICLFLIYIMSLSVLHEFMITQWMAIPRLSGRCRN